MLFIFVFIIDEIIRNLNYPYIHQTSTLLIRIKTEELN